MKVQRRMRRAVAVLICGLVGTGVVWANGEEFFGSKNTKLDTYYFGHIKDADGKVLDNAVVTIIAKNINMKFPFRNDAPGHFRSPDIGESVEILRKAGLASEDAPPAAGVLVGTNEPTTRLQMAQDFIAAIARHRHWGRPLAEQVPA